jgi:hypothetical protein
MHMKADDHRLQIRKIQEELTRAEEARARGNEGMARVCARRAAGTAIGEFLVHQGITGAGYSAYERLKVLKTLNNIPSKVIVTVEHLLMHVDEEHMLPADIDLIEEARWLIHTLLPGAENQ